MLPPGTVKNVKPSWLPSAAHGQEAPATCWSSYPRAPRVTGKALHTEVLPCGKHFFLTAKAKGPQESKHFLKNYQF